MGVEVVLALVIGSCVTSLIGGGVSVATLFHMKKSSSSEVKESTKIRIENQIEETTTKDGDRTTKKIQNIEIVDIDAGKIASSMSITRTGLPNDTASTIASGGAAALTAVSGPGPDILENVANGAMAMGANFLENRNKNDVKNVTEEKVNEENNLQVIENEATDEEIEEDILLYRQDEAYLDDYDLAKLESQHSIARKGFDGFDPDMMPSLVDSRSNVDVSVKFNDEELNLVMEDDTVHVETIRDLDTIRIDTIHIDTIRLIGGDNIQDEM